MIAWLKADSPFPAVENALADPNGLLAAGADLSVARLLAAYSRGIFPWYSEGQPILWWSPDPRMVLDVEAFKVSRSLGKRIRQRRFELCTDVAFRAVVNACAAAPRLGQFGTWITPQMVEAYDELHLSGYAHSVEAWRDGKLVGGLYGIALGRVFFGESMFAAETDASKVALAALVHLLRRLGTQIIDCQQETEHLATFGARPIPRRRFAALLETLIDSPTRPADWPRGALGDLP